MPVMERFEYDFQSISDWFSNRVKHHPHRVAVVSESGLSMTYQELDHVSRQLTQRLKESGIAPGSTVVIYLDRCLEFVISYLAILQAGAAYVPLEVTFSKELTASLMVHVKPKAIVTKAEFADQCKESLPKTEIPLICLDLNQNGACNIATFIAAHDVSDKHTNSDLHSDVICLRNKPISSEHYNDDVLLEEGTNGNNCVGVSEDDDRSRLSHIIFTSGTTGLPKGIAGTNRNLLHTFHWWLKLYPYESDDKEACNIAFIWEFPRPILAGVPMYVISDSTIADPCKLGTFIQKHGITRLFVTSSLLELLIDILEGETTHYLASLRMLILCGELVTFVLLRRILSFLPTLRVVNLYGISEAADVCALNLTDWYHQNTDYQMDYCPVGKPIPGVEIHLLNENMEAVREGSAGEVYIKGPTIAIGYYGNPAATEKCFVRLEPPDTYSYNADNHRCYRTFDKGMLLPDNNLLILGRAGHVVQIRGNSVDIQVVESQLMRISGVLHAVVKVCPEGSTHSIRACVISHVTSLTEADIKAELRKVMADYMVPSRICITKTLPIKATSGKADISAIVMSPRDDCRQSEKADETSNNKSGRKLVEKCDVVGEIIEIWKQVLGEDCNVSGNFFDAGGHSLAAARFVALVNKRLHTSVPLSVFLCHATLCNIVHLVRQCYTGSACKISSVDQTNTKICVQDEVRSLLPDIPSSFRVMLDLFRRFSSHDSGSSMRILLTGATGFLGVHLLHEILVSTDNFVICLIRGKSTDDGFDRLVDSLHEYKLLDEGDITVNRTTHELAYCGTTRASVVIGDASKDAFDLDKSVYSCLSAIVDVAVHAAAQVNFIYPYQLLKASNCSGTKNVLEFCCTTKVKPLHYISSASVVPKPGSGFEFQWSHLHDGYGQSKYIAELLVRQVMSCGLPVVVYRPGNIWGDQKRAILNKKDIHAIFIRACIRMRLLPDVAFLLEATPVDVISNFIVSRLGRTLNINGSVYDLMNRNRFSISMLLTELKRLHPEMKVATPEEWIMRLEDECFDDSCLLRDLVKNCSHNHPNHEDGHDAVNAGEELPKMSPEQLRKYLIDF